MKLIRKKKKDKLECTAQKTGSCPWKVLVVDDEPDIHVATRMAFEEIKFDGRPLKTLKAMSGIEAQEILRNEPHIAVALIDVVMETDDAGLRLVDFIRNTLKNTFTRLIIRTGQPGLAPEQEVVERYDIDDYKDKTDLTVQKLFTTMRLALKSYKDINDLETNRKGLQSILEVTKDLYQPQQSDKNIYDLVLAEIIRLCNLNNIYHPFPIENGMIVTTSAQKIEVQATTGKFDDWQENPDMQAVVQTRLEAVETDADVLAASNIMLIPCGKHDGKDTFVYLENAQHLSNIERNLVQVMISESAIALQRAANQKILVLNEKLKEDNMRMTAELNVARQLQQMVLPKEQELQKITSLDIAGFMEAADEVGGDYYDVLEYDGEIKIGIGDVTGHGLESGVLMLMVQTAVRSLLISEVTDPQKFLNLLNRIIYDNVQRMNTDKNLTLSLLNYKNGVLQLTGQHEYILLVRKDSTLEAIDTFDLGFSVGIEDNIADFVSRKEVVLHPGDGIVLYTDGITEARNIKKKMYGLARLCEIISRNWHLSSKEIQQVIISDVRQHIGEQKVYDDITLLVLKEK